MKKFLNIMVWSLILFALAGCGGGGSTGAATKKAVARLSLAATTFGNMSSGSLTGIKAIRLDLSLPDNVSVALNPDGTVSDTVVEFPAGTTNTFKSATYSSSSRTLTLNLIYLGYTGGPFATVHAEVLGDPASISIPATLREVSTGTGVDVTSQYTCTATVASP